MKIEFLEPAQQELDEAIEYYNAQVVGLGNQFLDEVVNTLQRIADYPEDWQVFSEKTRRSHLAYPTSRSNRLGEAVITGRLANQPLTTITAMANNGVSAQSTG